VENKAYIPLLTDTSGTPKIKTWSLSG